MRWGPVAVFVAACAAQPPSDAVTNTVEQALTMCPATVVEGLDVYNGTGTIDWAKVHASGRGFAFIKATQGDYNTQSSFPTNWTAAQANGLRRSPYHFFDGTVDGIGQARAFLAALDAIGGLGVGDLPALLDIECPTSATQANAQSNCEHTGDSGWVTPAVLKQRIFDWLDTVEQATGRKPIIYSYPSWFAAVGMTDPRLAAYPLFIASYNSCATIPQPWTTAVFWQYSATGTVPGVSAGADVDRFFGSQADLDGFTIQPPVQAGDAGVDPGGEMKPPAGCGCQGSAPSSLWPVAALGILLVRKKRIRR
jgi:lysozyme